MANKTMGGLTAADDPLLLSDLIPVSRGGSTTKKTTLQKIKDLIATTFTGDAGDIAYTPGTSGNWNNVPSNVEGGLDELALVLGSDGKTIRAPRVQSVTSSATVTPTFLNDLVKITAQAAGLTLANLSGTKVPGHGIVIRIKDNGTSRSITYGSEYRSIGVALPTATVISKTLYLAGIWNHDDTKLDIVAVAQEA